MSTSHTPGPWSKTGQSVKGKLSVCIAWCGESMVCGANGSYSISAKEANANARLIAAAPDLLAALQWVMSATGEQLTSAFEAAQDAIAKATGEPNEKVEVPTAAD